MDLFTGLSLVALMLLFAVLALSRRERDSDVQAAAPLAAGGHTRLEAHVAALDVPGARQDAERALLAMGPNVIPHLLGYLERVDRQPFALSPAQQLAIEGLLADFGPQTLLQVGRSLRRVHRVSPLFPAIVRILERLGPAALEDLLSAREDLPFALMAPLFAALRRTLDPDLCGRALAHNAHSEDLLVAALPHLLSDPELDGAVRRRAPEAGEALDRLLGRCGLRDGVDVEPLKPCAWHVDASISELLARLDADQVDGATAVRCLACHLDDPRAQERLIGLVEVEDNDATVATLAVRELARVGFRNLQPLLNRLLRAPYLSEHDLARTKGAVLLHPGPCVQALVLAMRSETPRVVTRAAEVLAVLPVDEHLVSFLKALGRHRYSPLESAIAAPILARWPSLAGAVLQATRQEDREVQLSAIELVGFYGGPAEATQLLELWGKRDVLNDVVANAVELIGPGAVEAIESRLGAESTTDAHLLRRRLELLRLLGEGPQPLAEPDRPSDQG